MDSDTVGGLVTAIGSMASTTKTIIETIKTARTKSKNPEVEKSLSAALEQIYSLETGIVDLKTKILTLKKENLRLREKISEEEDRAKDREKYQRKQVGKATVLVCEAEPSLFFCPACYATKVQAIPLQGLSEDFEELGSHQCSSCKAYFHITT